MVVERQPVDHLVHRLALRGEALAVQAPHLQAAPQALGGRIDAPMSSGAGGIRQISQDQRVELTNDVALEATMDLLFR